MKFSKLGEKWPFSILFIVFLSIPILSASAPCEIFCFFLSSRIRLPTFAATPDFSVAIYNSFLLISTLDGTVPVKVPIHNSSATVKCFYREIYSRPLFLPAVDGGRNQHDEPPGNKRASE
jgi:hypothetical protein